MDLERQQRRAVALLAKMEPAVSGQAGHKATFAAALALVRGLELPEDAAYELLAREYNPRCDPPWSEKELRHKVATAADDGTLPMGHIPDKRPPLANRNGRPSARHNGRRAARRAAPKPPAWSQAWEGGAAAPVAALDPEGLAERAAIVGESLAVEALAAGRFATLPEALAWGWAEADRLVCQAEEGAPELVRTLADTAGAPGGWPPKGQAALALDATGHPVGLRGVTAAERPDGEEQIATLPPWGTAPGLLADPVHGLPLLRGTSSPELCGVLLAGTLPEWARLAEQAAREGEPLAVLGVCPGDGPALAAAAARWPAHLELAALAACVEAVNAALAPLRRRAREVKS